MRRALLIIAGVALLVAAVTGGRLLLKLAAARTPDGTDLAPLTGDQHRVAIVFGAGLGPGGLPSPLLDDRLRAAEELYRRGIVDRLLMTGDNSTAGHNEPGAMRRASLARGIPEEVIAVDYGGRRTWDSCQRARVIFGIEHAVVVSSDFHRARTVATCRAAGVRVDGATGASTRKYGLRERTGWHTRELAASWRAMWDAWIDHPDVPVKGDPIDIYDPAAVRASLSEADRRATP